jgi:hypothetical protein
MYHKNSITTHRARAQMSRAHETTADKQYAGEQARLAAKQQRRTQTLDVFGKNLYAEGAEKTEWQSAKREEIDAALTTKRSMDQAVTAAGEREDR